VKGAHGEAGKPLPPPPPAGSEADMVSDFDNGKVEASYGMWVGAGDQMNGGKSMASLTVVQPGAESSKGALQVNGEVVAGAPMAYAGAMYFPGAKPMQPVNLSSKKEISFWAKGDGKSYAMLVLTERRSGNNGQMPAMTTFVAGPEWKQYSFPFTLFETDGSDLTALGFMRSQQPGKFEFQLDQVRIK